MKSEKMLHMVAYLILFVGGLNWLLFAILKQDIGAWLPGGMQGKIARAVYLLVGLATIYLIATHKSYCKHCSGKMAMKAPGMGSGTPM